MMLKETADQYCIHIKILTAFSTVRSGPGIIRPLRKVSLVDNRLQCVFKEFQGLVQRPLVRERNVFSSSFDVGRILLERLEFFEISQSFELFTLFKPVYAVSYIHIIDCNEV